MPIVLISPKAGRTGLNLTAADSRIHDDPGWKSAGAARACARVHRIGQNTPRFVNKMRAPGTVAGRILAKQARKRARPACARR